MDREEIRQECRAARRGLSETARREKSAAVCRQIQSLPQYRETTLLCAYMATQGEVDLQVLIEDAGQRGKTVALPRVCGKRMSYYEVRSRRDLTEGSFHILEPREGTVPVSPGEEALLIVPGIAFDVRGNRLGFGGGYYDRYLAEHPGLFTVGAAFAFQMRDALPRIETDVALCRIVTEEGWCGGNTQSRNLHLAK